VRKTLLVGRFEQARPQLSMDRQRAPNDPIRLFIEFHSSCSSCSSVRRAKPGQSSSLKGGCHVNADEACSCGLSRGGNEARGARSVRGSNRAKRSKAVDSEAVSRKPSKVEPGSASKHKLQVAKLPEKLKPARCGKSSAHAPYRPVGVRADGA